MAAMQSRRLALVNGADSAVGQAIAAGLARRGVAVLLGGAEQNSMAGLVEAGEVRPVRLDLARPDCLPALADWIRETHGALDGLIHQAVTSGAERDQGDLEHQRAGVVMLTEGLIPLLAASGQGRMVILTSRSGCAQPDGVERGAGLAVRAAAIALNRLTQQYAQALTGQGIKVNAVCPENGVQAAIHMAVLDADGPTGSLTDDLGELSW